MSSTIFGAHSMMHLFALMPAMFLAALFDLHRRRIPNWLVGVIAAGGLIVAVVDGGIQSAATGVISAGTAMVACMPFYLLRGLAGGDVKLIAAGAFWLTLAELLVALAAIALCGALMGAGYLLFSRDATHLPYAVAIAAGTGAAVWLF